MFELGTVRFTVLWIKCKNNLVYPKAYADVKPTLKYIQGMVLMGLVPIFHIRSEFIIIRSILSNKRNREW